jgi:glycosyltransferase involved in cell wall biosynthesis
MSVPPLVSVVIPTHNSADYAEEAVASVLGQSFDDLEILLVDDGSSLVAAAALEKIAEHERVRLLRQPRAGANRARRRGWEAARGRYVAFLDDDDRHLQGHLESCFQRLETDSEAAAAYTRFREVDPAGRLLRVRPRRGYSGRAFAQEVRKGSVKTSTLMVRRQALLELSDLIEHSPAGGNYDLILRLRYRHSFVFIEEPQVEVKSRAGSVSRRPSQPYLTKAEILENLRRVFPEMRGAERRALHHKIAKYYVKAGDAARGWNRIAEARRLYRKSLASRWTAGGLGRYLQSLADGRRVQPR